ncbi:unnamed protein product [Coregonus sp. 'balchen']|nr:unnamed protein product [Coregonus sp. 'balchen']
MTYLKNSQALNPGTPKGLVQNMLQCFLSLRYAPLAYNEATNNNLDPRERGRESKTVASLEKCVSKWRTALLFISTQGEEWNGDSIWYTSKPMGVNYLAALLPAGQADGSELFGSTATCRAGRWE